MMPEMQAPRLQLIHIICSPSETEPAVQLRSGQQLRSSPEAYPELRPSVQLLYRAGSGYGTLPYQQHSP